MRPILSTKVQTSEPLITVEYFVVSKAGIFTEYEGACPAIRIFETKSFFLQKTV